MNNLQVVIPPYNFTDRTLKLMINLYRHSTMINASKSQYKRYISRTCLGDLTFPLPPFPACAALDGFHTPRNFMFTHLVTKAPLTRFTTSQAFVLHKKCRSYRPISSPVEDAHLSNIRSPKPPVLYVGCSQLSFRTHTHIHTAATST